MYEREVLAVSTAKVLKGQHATDPIPALCRAWLDRRTVGQPDVPSACFWTEDAHGFVLAWRHVDVRALCTSIHTRHATTR